jgi:hypothetical protein
LLKPEFEKEVWDRLILLGEGSRFLLWVPSVQIRWDADPKKPLTFEKEELEEEFSHTSNLIYTIKNK